MQHVKRMLRIILSPVVYSPFSTLSYKKHHFGKNSIEHKMCVLIFSTTFV